MTNPMPPPELLGAPPGTIPNLVNPVNQTELFIVLHSICLVIITLGLAMRLYTRKFIVKRSKVDDYLCVFAYPFSIGIWIYIITVAVIKLACLSFYRNIFMSIRKTLMFVNVGIIAVLVLYTVMLFAQVFQCVPVAVSWDNTIDGYCTKVHFVTYYSGFVNTFSDIYVLMLPIPAVWALPLAPTQKLQILSVFALGLM
ncbi:hypothetical protein HYALB_00011792 [Hymenoscyphus albidus]|uniref:Rhodopsin domain-containing protein n=1 Tax=Hymenoscyphus albidus TaxID=595503 RepID=A0A9N9Q8T3_9HELO|nr:hypothetical protein HYALB_00011792 [Hymenoscyphus albidus]